ncbi:MAG: hypothetical protein GX121_00030 [Ignavibacteria bacterium]|jgi:ferredoxin|nr:hypothetical protein [Ignavibacteria bacterium]
MQELHNKIKSILENGSASLFIAYQKSREGKITPTFITKPEQSQKAYFGDDCKQNLAVYIHKQEVKNFGKVGIFANIYTLKSLLQIYAENQIRDDYLKVVTINPNGAIVEFANFMEIENYVNENKPAPNPEDMERVEKLSNLSREERWDYWLNELSTCIKCYACRAACPMCYCTKCTVDCNQPQWISTPSHSLGNIEWHIMRAMHLAGRCVECNECARVCPMDIPLNLLTVKLNDTANIEFGQQAGLKGELDYALSTFKVDDKENFIR